MGVDKLSSEDIARLLQVSPSSTGKARAGWEVDAIEVGRACEFMRIELPVRFRFTSGRRQVGGQATRWDFEQRAWYHRITVSQLHTAQYANNTIWHELAHCMQAESFARRYMQQAHNIPTFENGVREFNKDYDRRGYKHNPYEIEANQIAALRKEWWLMR